MSNFRRWLRQYSFTLLVVVLSGALCAGQKPPTSKAQPTPRTQAAGKATRATLGAVVPAGKPCPVTVNLNGSITASGAVEVKYTWVSSDNATWPEHTVNFAKAGTEKVTETWQLGKTYTGWVQLEVVSPNALVSPRANFKVNCGGSPGGAGKVTRATLGAVVPLAGACPKTVTFKGAITTNGPATVKYTWVSFDGGTWPEGTLNFARAGTQQATESRQVFVTGTGWMQLKVLSPNAVMSPRANYKVTCAATKK